jgi:archaellum component FlaF (FlaF/FlaG flagellin family)
LKTETKELVIAVIGTTLIISSIAIGIELYKSIQEANNEINHAEEVIKAPIKLFQKKDCELVITFHTDGSSTRTFNCSNERK